MHEVDRYGPNTPQVRWLIEQLRNLSVDQLENIATVELTTRRTSGQRLVLGHLLTTGLGRTGDQVEDVRSQVMLAMQDASIAVDGSRPLDKGEGDTARGVDTFLGPAFRAVAQATAALVLRSFLTSVEFEKYWGALESEIHLLEREAGG